MLYQAGTYRAFLFVGASRQVAPEGKLAGASAAGDMVNSVSNIKLSMIAMVVWVIIVTIALVVIGVLSFRRWRRDYFLDGQSNSDGSHSSSADSDSELGSNLGTEMGMDNAVGLSNGAFEHDELPHSICVQGDTPGSDSSSTLDMFASPGDATRL